MESRLPDLLSKHVFGPHVSQVPHIMVMLGRAETMLCNFSRGVTGRHRVAMCNTVSPMVYFNVFVTSQIRT